MADITRDPVRKIALPFAGDPWAQPGAQVPIPSEGPTSVQRLTITAKPLRWRVIAYDGVGPSAAPVDADTTTIDMTVVKLRTDRHGNVTLARTVTLVEDEGAEVLVGEQLTEEDVSPSETACLGFVNVTQGAAASVWVFVDAGSSPTAGSSGTA